MCGAKRGPYSRDWKRRVSQGPGVKGDNNGRGGVKTPVGPSPNVLIIGIVRGAIGQTAFALAMPHSLEHCLRINGVSEPPSVAG